MPPAEHYHILVTGPGEIARGERPINAATLATAGRAGEAAERAMAQASRGLRGAKAVRVGDTALLFGGVPPAILSVAAPTRCVNLACYVGALRDNGHEVVG